MEVICPHCTEKFDIPVPNAVQVIDAMGTAMNKMMFSQAQQQPQELVVEDVEPKERKEPYDPWIELGKELASGTPTDIHGPGSSTDQGSD